MNDRPLPTQLHPALRGSNLYPASLAGITLITAWLLSQYQANLLAVWLVLNAVLIIRFRTVPLVFCLMALMMIFARSQWWTLPPYPPLFHSMSWLPVMTVALVLLSFRCCTFAPQPLSQLLGTTPQPRESTETDPTVVTSTDDDRVSPPHKTPRRKGPFERFASYLLLGWLARRIGNFVRGLLPSRRVPSYRDEASFVASEATGILGLVIAVAVISAVTVSSLPAVDRHAYAFSMQGSGMRLVVLIVFGCLAWYLINVGLNYLSLRSLSPLVAAVSMRRELLQGHLAEYRVASRAGNRHLPVRFWPSFRRQTRE
ncbi:MAG: hypothetical protein U0795_02100 [Pirellulales bacterium]